MRKKKYFIIVAVLAVTLSITACNSSTGANTSSDTTAVAQSDSKYQSETIDGQVSAVDGNDITITIGTLGSFETPSGETPSGEVPSGEVPSGEAPSGEAPSGEAPSGEAPSGGAPGNMPSAIFTPGEDTDTITVASDTPIYQEGDSDSETEASLSDIQEGSVISITFDSEGAIEKITIQNAVSSENMQNSGMPGGGTQSSGVDSYDAVTTFDEDATTDGETYQSTGTDENAILVENGADVTLNQMTLNRTSEDSTGGDNSSFYGVGAGLLVTDGTVHVNGGTITTDAAGGAGVFSYGDGVAYVSDATIKTTMDTSGGIHVAGGGTLYAYNVTAETDGGSSAAIRSDRGSGTMVVDGGTYTSNGSGSPAVYSTADITVNNATLTATGSEAVCIEGLNTLRLFDTDLTGNMPENEQNDNIWTVILYQSMSGDSEVGNSTFEMTGGSLTSQNGGLFYTTNTESAITLKDVDIHYSDSNDFFLQCTGNTNARGWGSAGSNGADCVFTAISQDMEGDVIWDSISDLDFYMTDGSTLQGAILDDETYAGEGSDGYANVYISKDSKWVVTKDSTLTNLYNEGTIVDASGKTVSIVGADGTVYVKGTSSVTVTVASYSDSVDLSGANNVSNYSDYAVTNA